MKTLIILIVLVITSPVLAYDYGYDGYNWQQEHYRMEMRREQMETQRQLRDIKNQLEDQRMQQRYQEYDNDPVKSLDYYLHRY